MATERHALVLGDPVGTERGTKTSLSDPLDTGPRVPLRIFLYAPPIQCCYYCLPRLRSHVWLLDGSVVLSPGGVIELHACLSIRHSRVLGETSRETKGAQLLQSTASETGVINPRNNWTKEDN